MFFISYNYVLINSGVSSNQLYCVPMSVCWCVCEELSLSGYLLFPRFVICRRKAQFGRVEVCNIPAHLSYQVCTVIMTNRFFTKFVIRVLGGMCVLALI